MSTKPHDPPLDMNARLMDDVYAYAAAFNSADREKMADAEDGIRFWMREIGNKAASGAYNRSYSNVACCNSIIEHANRIGDLAIVANPSLASEVKQRLAAIVSKSGEIKDRDDSVVNGGGR